MKTIKTRLHYYLYGVTENTDHRKQYREMTRRLKGINKTTVATWDEYFIDLKTQDVELNTKELFHSSWIPVVKSKVRIYDWLEVNRSLEGKVLEGYYLEQTEEMTRIRDETYKCIHCGAMYPIHHKCSFCLKCISQIDTDERLYLLFLRPVATHGIEINTKSILIPQWLVDEWQERREAKRVFDNLASSRYIDTETDPYPVGRL